jgi:hypothetical protein
MIFEDRCAVLSPIAAVCGDWAGPNLARSAFASTFKWCAGATFGPETLRRRRRDTCNNHHTGRIAALKNGRIAMATQT